MLTPAERQRAQLNSLIKLEQEIRERHGVDTPVIPKDKLPLFKEIDTGLKILTGETPGVVTVTI
jgi:hypothetical protein